MPKPTIIKICSKHGETEFRMEGQGTKHERYRCKKCGSEAVQKRRRKVKKLLVEYKGGCCEKCGYNKCVDALEFHHIDPTQKDFGIGSKGHCRSLESMKKEVDKCIMVCANCHREIHSQESN